jgi:hypothetical protein
MDMAHPCACAEGLCPHARRYSIHSIGLSKFFAGGRRDVDETGAVGSSQFNRIVRAGEFIRLVAERPPSIPLLAGE